VIANFRDPLARFASAVRYTLKYWAQCRVQQCREAHVRAITEDQGLTTANEWAEALAGVRGVAAQEAVLVEVGNIGGQDIDGAVMWGNEAHKIDGKQTKWKWTYTPQHFWVSGVPKHVLRHSHLDKDWTDLLKELKFETSPLKWSNQASAKKNEEAEFSDVARQYLLGVYKEDCDLFNSMKLSMPSCELPW
jgi:hypothetical protein